VCYECWHYRARLQRFWANSTLARREIILGAAVIDDVLGLLILAVVAGAIKATGTGGALSLGDVGMIALKALGLPNWLDCYWTFLGPSAIAWGRSLRIERRTPHSGHFFLSALVVGGREGWAGSDSRCLCRWPYPGRGTLQTKRWAQGARPERPIATRQHSFLCQSSSS